MRKFTFMFIILIAMPVWAERPVGMINSFNGPSSAYMLDRDGQELKVKLHITLYEA